MDGYAEIMVGFGKAVLKQSTIMLSCFKVDKPWNRIPAQTSGRRRPGTSSKHLVGSTEINGALYIDTVGHEPGTILLISSSMKRGPTPVSDGAIFLRLRPGAPRINVGAKLPPAQDNFLGTRFVLFHGEADMLSVEEAELLGVRVPRKYVDQFFNQEELDERFDVIEIQPETRTRPELQVVETADGRQQVIETAAPPQRRMRFRR